MKIDIVEEKFTVELFIKYLQISKLSFRIFHILRSILIHTYVQYHPNEFWMINDDVFRHNLIVQVSSRSKNMIISAPILSPILNMDTDYLNIGM